MKYLVISFLVVAMLLVGANVFAYSTNLSGIDSSLLGDILNAFAGSNLSPSTTGGAVVVTPGNTVPGAIPPGYYTSTAAGDSIEFTKEVKIFGNRGTAGAENFSISFPGGGNLADTRVAAIKHWDGFWSALWLKAGGLPNGGNRALYTDGPVTMMNGNVGIGIESPYSQDKLHVAGNIRADDTIVASKGLCVGGGTDEFRCTNDGNQSGAWCGITHYIGGIPVSSFPCKGVAAPGCPTGYGVTLVSSDAYNRPETTTCMKLTTGYP